MNTPTATAKSTSVAADGLRYPIETPPKPDEAIEIAPGIVWVRLTLPFRLNHVNIYLIADGDGWTMVDTGIGTETTVAAWTVLFDGPLKNFKITRLLVTHHHPDHVGLAGWVVERFGCPLLMSQVEYFMSAYHQPSRSDERRQAQRLFFQRHGMSKEVTDALVGRGQDYLKRVSVLPSSFHRLSHGDELSIGARTFEIFAGGGHSQEQIMLYCRKENIFLSADQVLSKISPNVSVWAVEPNANSLGLYLNSLAGLDKDLDDGALVLPGHGVPFYGVKTRIKQLADHHEERCQMIANACRTSPKTSAELVPVVFHKHVLDAHQTGFAAGELIAHVNYMLAHDRLKSDVGADDVLRFTAT